MATPQLSGEPCCEALAARLRLAKGDGVFRAAWNNLPEEARTALERGGLDTPAIWSGLVDDSDEAERVILAIVPELCGELRRGSWESLTVELLILRAASIDAGQAQIERASRVSDFQLAIEQAQRKRKASEEARDEEQKKLEIDALKRRPAEWKGKRTRRTQSDDPQARETAEAKERERWALEVVGLLHEAELPFCELAAGTTPTAMGTRCCQGLRFRTLRKYVRSWRPFRRYLVAHGHTPPFPATVGPVLDYLKVVTEEKPPASFYKDFRGALRFFEAAGERPTNERLANTPALANLVAEVALVAASRPKRGRPKGKQAPTLPTAVLAAIEHVVVDPSRPPFARYYGWTKLIRHWTSLRWDDTLGLSPSSFRRRARGLLARLERTKVSGPGKKVLVLPIFCSDRAYIEVPGWLDAGLELHKESFGFERDFLLPVATLDLKGCTRLRADYSDAVCYTKQLLGSLEDPRAPGEALLHPEATANWSEHSERAGLDSWHAALGTESSQRSFLGRWAARSSTDTYVRTAVKVVERLQLQAATEARKSHNGGQDRFGEEHALQELMAFLLERGVSEEECADQLRRLTRADTSLYPDEDEDKDKDGDGERRDAPTEWGGASGATTPGSPGGDTGAGSHWRAGGGPGSGDTTPEPSAWGGATPETPTEPGDEETAGPEQQRADGLLAEIMASEAAGETSGSEAPASPAEARQATEASLDLAAPLVSEGEEVSDLSEEEIERARALQEPEGAALPHGFVVSHVQAGNRLHYVGHCGRIPGRHYLKYTVFGDTRPNESEFNLTCSNCFKGAAVGPADGHEDSSLSDTSDQSTEGEAGDSA